MNIFGNTKPENEIQKVVSTNDTMVKDSARTKYKDTVFHFVFSQPDVLLDLYKSLHHQTA